MMMRLLTFAFAVAAAHDYAADVDGTGQDSKNETLDEGYSLEGLQLNLSTCDLFIVALAMAENSPLIDSFEAGPAETLRQEPHLARCAVGLYGPLELLKLHQLVDCILRNVLHGERRTEQRRAWSPKLSTRSPSSRSRA